MAILRTSPKSHWQGHEVSGCNAPNLSRFSLGFFFANLVTTLESGCDRAPNDAITWLGTSWTTHLLPLWWANFEFWNARPGCLGHGHAKVQRLLAASALNDSENSETSLFVFVFAGGGGSHSFIHPVKFWKMLDSKMWTCSNMFRTHRCVFFAVASCTAQEQTCLWLYLFLGGYVRG